MKKSILVSIIILVVIISLGFIFVSTGLVSLKNNPNKIVAQNTNNTGYNYKLHLYKGTWCEYSNTSLSCGDYKNINLDLNWNEEYMSSTPNQDGVYERHVGFDSYIGSDAKLTKHYYGKYTKKGIEKDCIWNDEQTFLAAPVGAILRDRIWYNEANEELGKQDIEVGMMLVKEINSDSCDDSLNGVYYSPNLFDKGSKI